MCTTTLPLEVFSQRNFVADFIQLKLTFIQKRKSSLFEPPFGRLIGNVRTSSIARWKARVRLLIRIIELFSLALTVETLQAEICRHERLLKGWVISIAHFRWKGTSPTNQPLLGGRKLEGLPFHTV